MDILVGYVSFVYDADTIMLTITQQNGENKHIYDHEEKVKLTNSLTKDISTTLRSIADYRLIDKLLYKKVEVEVEKKDRFEIVGRANILSA